MKTGNRGLRMSVIAIYYASLDGQARKIALRLGEMIERQEQDVTVTDLGHGFPPISVVEQADVVVVVAAVRYGRHLKKADQFLFDFEPCLSNKKLVLLSVNLTARKPEKRDIERSVYLKKWVERHSSLAPVVVRAIAGRLDYPSYSRFDRFMIQMIMKITKGPTDPTVTIEYTDWNQVQDLAREIAAIR